jgi:hypothetical protein
MRLRPLIFLLIFCCGPYGWAQARQNQLSEAEVESLREAAYFPSSRVLVFQKIIDSRIARIQDLVSKRYQAGKTEDLHDAIQQIAGIAIELEDNLEDYDRNHRDLRKSLPKLLDAAERWTSILKQPEESPAYEVQRRLALDAVDDIRKECTELIPEQKAWFKEHPPAKEDPHPPIEEKR